MADQDPATNSVNDDTAAELERLRAENEALRAQADQQPESHGVRSVISWILVILAVIAVVAGALAVWLQTTISDEDTFVETLAPLPSDPAFARAIAERLSDELIEAAEVSSGVEDNLPLELSFLAVPITEGLRTLGADVATELIRSDAFSGIWQAASRATHAGVSTLLSTGGKVSLDLNEAANELVSALEARDVSLLSDREFDLPEIVVFQNDQLEEAAGVLERIDNLAWFVPLIALVLIIAAIWVSPDRRRTAAGLGFGSAAALLTALAIVRVVQARSVENIEDETGSAAAGTVWNALLRFYRQSIWALIIFAFIVGFAAWVIGPSERAGRVRSGWQRTIRRWQGRDAATPTTGVAGFIASWKRPLQWGSIIVGLLFVVVAPNPSGWLVIITALVVLAVVAVFEVVAGPEARPDDSQTDDEAPNGEIEAPAVEEPET